MKDCGLIVIDTHVMERILSPDRPGARRCRRIFEGILDRCTWRIALSEALEKQYESVLHRYVDEYDTLKNELQDRGKSVFVSKSKIGERPLDRTESKAVTKADRKDMLLFELARAAGAKFIITDEDGLHRVRIKGTLAVSMENAAMRIGIDASE